MYPFGICNRRSVLEQSIYTFIEGKTICRAPEYSPINISDQVMQTHVASPTLTSDRGLVQVSTPRDDHPSVPNCMLCAFNALFRFLGLLSEILGTSCISIDFAVEKAELSEGDFVVGSQKS